MVVIATDPDFDPATVIMEFRLTFDGNLMSTGSRGRPAHVHEIRRRFHPQLKRYWKARIVSTVAGDFEAQVKMTANKFVRNGYRFVPLIERDGNLTCAISVLLLRPPTIGTVLSNADLDGQLATLFDALSMPRHAEQLKGFETPRDEENPFFCLVEDDSLITQVAVESSLLLEETRDGLEGNAARAVISVQLSPHPWVHR